MFNKKEKIINQMVKHIFKHPGLMTNFKNILLEIGKKMSFRKMNYNKATHKCLEDFYHCYLSILSN